MPTSESVGKLLSCGLPARAVLPTLVGGLWKFKKGEFDGCVQDGRGSEVGFARHEGKILRV